ncbi:MAG: OmpA family protein [Chitinophagaceae bacterium]
MRHLYVSICLLIVTSSFSQQSVTHTVYFDLDIAQPSAAATRDLHSFGEKIKQLPVTGVSIEGHTDKQGTNNYNYTLSRARSEAVNNLLKPYIPSSVSARINFSGEDRLITDADEKQAVNRRVVIVVYYEEAPQPVTEVEPFFRDVETQRFAVNFDDTIFITGKDGTKLAIPPGSIQNKKGELVNGNAEILLKEYYNPGDIISSGLNTNSDKGLLQTGGMFTLVIIQGNDTMDTKSRKPVTLKMPVVNQVAGNMNVFTMGHRSDSSVWRNTNSVFSKKFSYWDWPRKLSKLDDLVIPEIKYENWRKGYKYTDEYTPHTANWWLFEIPFGNKSDAKQVTNQIEKIDSVTLRSTVKVKYRNKGKRQYGIQNFDTTFLVKFYRSEYVGVTQSLNWINCDRFLNYPNTGNFYVSTPGFRGATVMVYFKNLSSYMPAYSDEGKSNALYTIPKVPPGQKVVIVAIGKRDGAYFFSRKEFTTEKGATAELELTDISEEDLNKEMRSLK